MDEMDEMGPVSIAQVEPCVVPLQLSRLPAGEGEEGKLTRRSEYGVTFIRAGLVARRDGQPSNWRLLPEALQAAVPMFSGLGMSVDHPSLANMFSPSLRDTAGVTFGAKWHDANQSIDGGARLYGRDDLAWLRQFLDEILEDQEAGREVPNVGLSAVLYHDSENVEIDGGLERHTTRIKHTESVDFVFGPGAEGRLHEALQFYQSFGVWMPGQQQGGAEGESKVDVNESEIVEEPQDVEATGEAGGQDLAGDPPQNGNGTGDLLGRIGQIERQLAGLDGLTDQVTRLGDLLAAEEEPQVVEGMGQAPRDGGPRVGGMLTPMERFAPNVAWLFGDTEAPLPDPQYRRADMIYQAMTGDWDWRGMFDPERALLAGANTTDLPNLAVNAMNKVIQLQYASLRSYRWYELVSAVAPNDGSVHDMAWLGTGGVGVLPTVAEKGAYTELSLADTKESDAFTKYGGYVGITLEMFRKSEIAKIQAVPVGLARSSVMTRSANFATIFTANAGVGPTLDDDSKALFHADHDNLLTTAFGSDSTAWNAVDLAMWNHAELGSAKPLAISPKYMLCNRALFRAALVAFGYGDGQPTTYVPEATDRGVDDPRPWPISVPDFSDANDWAAIVDPRIYPVINVSYAQQSSGGGHPLPELYAVTSETAGLVFTNDTLPIKVRDWYAYGVNGYRGIHKNNVA